MNRFCRNGKMNTFLASLAALSLSQQVIAVSVPHSEQFRAMVSVWERKPRGEWHQEGNTAVAVIGKKGLALNGTKREGDGKTPEGVFEVGRVFGEATASEFRGLLPYQTSSADWIGVDDPKSKYYNQVVKKSQIESFDWNSHEEMLRTDSVYRWLLEIRANPQNVPGFGSLIFFHVWRDAQTGTAGCVATDEKSVLRILRRLDPKKNPRVVIRTTAG